jgi:hypothetical protein
MKMNSSNSIGPVRKTASCLWLAAMLILLSCGTLGTGTTPQLTSATATVPVPSATPEPTGSPPNEPETGIFT